MGNKNTKTPPPPPYSDSIEENLGYLLGSYPDEILFDLKQVAKILKMSYEFIRLSVNSGYIAAKQIGKRRLVHRGELARLITEGVNNNGGKKK